MVDTRLAGAVSVAESDAQPSLAVGAAGRLCQCVIIVVRRLNRSATILAHQWHLLPGVAVAALVPLVAPVGRDSCLQCEWIYCCRVCIRYSLTDHGAGLV